MGISGFPLVPQYSCGNGNKNAAQNVHCYGNGAAFSRWHSHLIVLSLLVHASQIAEDKDGRFTSTWLRQFIRSCTSVVHSRFLCVIVVYRSKHDCMLAVQTVHDNAMNVVLFFNGNEGCRRKCGWAVIFVTGTETKGNHPNGYHDSIPAHLYHRDVLTDTSTAGLLHFIKGRSTMIEIIDWIRDWNRHGTNTAVSMYLFRYVDRLTIFVTEIVTDFSMLILKNSDWNRQESIVERTRLFQCTLLYYAVNRQSPSHCGTMPISITTSFTNSTRHRASTNTRSHFAFGAMLSQQRNPCTDCKSAQ